MPLIHPSVCARHAQALLSILDSPLCKAGKVKGLYIRTHKNVLISVNPKVMHVPHLAPVHPLLVLTLKTRCLLVLLHKNTRASPCVCVCVRQS